ncbi:hypothetical protein C4D60_Mb09t01490 [Musa balbisiana]|uniref:Uncharacterized protein n=1 Tax=Musa balbisiana TaxID=52838 RepID=A0A4S8IDD1_MUSBA|nr:hypothetical protein C4D60_Mb09t01490 [Musa balbisiana]
MAGKPQHSAFAPACSIRHSLLAVAVLALICFALLSLRSLRSHPQFSSPTVLGRTTTNDLYSVSDSPFVFLVSYNVVDS